MTDTERIAELERSLAAAQAALRELMDAKERHARATLMAENATNNFSDPKPELDNLAHAISDLDKAEKAARALLAPQEGER